MGTYVYTYMRVYTCVCINVVTVLLDTFSGMSRNETSNTVLNIEDCNTFWNNMSKTKFLISPSSPSWMCCICSHPISVKNKPFLSHLLSLRPWCCPWPPSLPHKPCPTRQNILFVVEFNNSPSPWLSPMQTLWSPLTWPLQAFKSIQAAVAKHDAWDGLSTVIPHGSGSQKPEIRVPAWSGRSPLVGPRLLTVPSHGRGGCGSLRGIFYKDMNFIHDLLASQRPHLLLPSQWALGFQQEF